MIMRNWDNCS